MTQLETRLLSPSSGIISPEDQNLAGIPELYPANENITFAKKVSRINGGINIFSGPWRKSPLEVDLIIFCKGMTTGGKWRAFCLDFSRSTTQDLRILIVTKNQLPNVLKNVRSCSIRFLSEIKLRTRTFGSWFFGAKVLSGRPRVRRAIYPLSSFPWLMRTLDEKPQNPPSLTRPYPTNLLPSSPPWLALG